MKTIVRSLTFLFAIAFSLKAHADELTKSLQTALKGADKLEITETLPGAKEGATFQLNNPKAIGKLIKSFDFIEEESGIPHASMGDCRAHFFRSNKKIVTLWFHHSLGLSWPGKWIGESVFTPASQKAWRDWFKNHGEPRFHDWHEGAIIGKERETANRSAFLAVFPKSSREIIEGYDQAYDDYHNANPEDFTTYLNDHPVLLTTKAKLAVSLPDRQDLASVISKALGTLSLRGQDCGSWSWYGHEVELVLETSHLLEAKDFQAALNSSDPATLLGLARLFFYGELSKHFTPSESGPIAAKLIEAVAKHDRAGNASLIFPWLARFSDTQITMILERIALGDLIFPSSDMNLSQDLTFPHLACLLLSKTDSPRFQECLKKVEALKPEYPDDKLALLVARSIRAKTNLLPETIFDSRSTQICLGALSVLEKQRTKKALDLIITKGTTHDWAAIREESVLTMERMTEKTWYQNGENERAEWHAKDIREWWGKEKQTFKFPE